MQKIVPHLWFDKEAKEAAAFYTSIFPNSKVTHTSTIHNTPSGDTDILSFDLDGYSFMAISAGPYFTINPSVSFFINIDPSREKNPEEMADMFWKNLSEGGKALMPMQEYPFSKKYGWIQDRFGVSWQIMVTRPSGAERPMIVPSMMFTKDIDGKAEEAQKFYQTLFKNAKQGILEHYPTEMGPDREGKVMYSDFMLEGQWFAAMDGGPAHEFKFNEAISFLIKCDTQEEIDYYWIKLSAVQESEQCGWLKDKFGFSWQVSPSRMDDMMKYGTPEQIDRVTQCFLKMKKFDLTELEKAYEGK